METDLWTLLEKEGLYYKLVEYAYDPIFVVNIAGKIIRMNNAAEELTGYTENELSDLPFLTLHPRSEYYKLLKDFKRGEGSKVLKEIKLIRKDKSMRYVDINAKFIKIKGQTFGMAILRDVTEQRKIKQELKESEEKYRETIDAINSAIHVVDRNLNILFANKEFKRWCKELGLSENLIGKNIFEIFPFLTEKVKKEYDIVMKEKKLLITVESNKVTDKIIHTETRKIPVFNDNIVVKIVTIVTDITKIKEARDALEESLHKS